MVFFESIDDRELSYTTFSLGFYAAMIWQIRLQLCIRPSVITARRYALRGLSHRNSVHLPVCLSVCYSHSTVTLVDCVHNPHGSTYDHDFYTIHHMVAP